MLDFDERRGKNWFFLICRPVSNSSFSHQRSWWKSGEQAMPAKLEMQYVSLI